VTRELFLNGRSSAVAHLGVGSIASLLSQAILTTGRSANGTYKLPISACGT